jgi:PTS system nitrogen regulatory IIA component
MCPSTNKEAERWMTAEEAAEYLQVAEATVKKWVKLDQIPHGKVGSMARFRKSDLDAWALANAEEHAA